MTDIHSGYIALVGKPNVGKSTLMNQVLGRKLSITSRKPQTTRQRVLGIHTTEQAQLIYVDTPGLHQEMPREINRYMNRLARASLHDVDVVVWLVDPRKMDGQDQWILGQLKNVDKPVVLAINKIDKIKHREELLPLMEKMAQEYSFAAVIPISAAKGDNLVQLEKTLTSLLPTGPLYFPPEQFTDRSDRFVAAEFLREKLLRYLGHELPYATTVTIDALSDEEKILRLAATIWVERDSQKAIVIGKQGAQLKQIGQAARQDLERYFGKQVYLRTWVKVKSNWSDDLKSMKQFGYDDSL